MSIGRKVKAVERIFESVDKEIAGFKSASGLNCLTGCGACCLKPDIEASILEFLPLALHLYKTGQLENVLTQLENEPGRKICVLLSPVIRGGEAGYCSQYEHRGLICRLFGFAATRNKNGELSIATCRKVKEAMPEIYQKANEDIRRGLRIPVFANYYMKLASIDPAVGQKMLPINEAIRKALETVALFFYYKNPKAS